MPTLGLIGDLHLGPDRGPKRGSAALPAVRTFLAAAERARVDRIVEFGDRVNEVDRDSDLANLQAVADAFRDAPAPVTHLLGNHDLHHLTREDAAATFRAPMEHEVLDLPGGWRLLAFRPDAHYLPREGRMQMGPAATTWLDRTLSEAPERATVVASHVPLMRMPLTGNPYFARRPHGRAWHLDVDDATRVLLRHEQVVACLHGHTHQPSVAWLDGILFATVPSPTETFATAEVPGEGFAFLHLGDTLDLRVEGLAPFALQAPVRNPRRTWSEAARAVASG